MKFTCIVLLSLAIVVPNSVTADTEYQIQNDAYLTDEKNGPPFFLLPKYKLTTRDIAVVINDRHPLSKQIGEYYQTQRNLPAANVVHVSIPPSQSTMTLKNFYALEHELADKLPIGIKALALTWITPFRVGCMSITSALTFGYDAAFCEKKTCRIGDVISPLFNDLAFGTIPNTYRPTMLLAAQNWNQAKALIDRGIAADKTFPPGTAYLVSTSDKERNVRAQQFNQVSQVLGHQTAVKIVHGESIAQKEDVLFYFTGTSHVSHLDTLRFRPGAIADHLTSSGGVLINSRQMSALTWLESGATGSYGTVVEPCNYPQKFPALGIVMSRYLAGQTLIEAYWQSVAWPKEGVFIGEPLAAPFSGYSVHVRNSTLDLVTSALKPGRYQLYSSASIFGPFAHENFVLTVKPGAQRFRLPNLRHRVYKLKNILL